MRQRREEKTPKQTFVLHSCVCYLKVLIHASIINVLNNLLSLLNLRMHPDYVLKVLYILTADL